MSASDSHSGDNRDEGKLEASVSSAASGGSEIGNTKVWDQVRQELAQVEEPQPPTGHFTGKNADATHGSERQEMNWARGYGRYLIVGGIICGLAIPELASLFRPFLVPLLIASLALALLQADFTQMMTYSARKMLIGGLLFILLFLCPVFVALEAKLVLVPYGLPLSIADGMILAAMAPPLLATPVIAFLLRLDATLALIVCLLSHVVAPISIALLAEWLMGPEISISFGELVQRLTILIGAGFVLGLGLRSIGLAKWLNRSPSNTAWIDSLAVINLTLLAIALMDGVTALGLTDPKFVALAFALGFILNPVLQLLGAALFSTSGASTSLTVGLLAGYRNTGVLIAVLAGSADPRVLTFLAIIQIPTFLMPMISSPILRRIRQLHTASA